MNPNYEEIAKTFVTQYYALFDRGIETRPQLGNFYSETNSLFTFEGAQQMGRTNILEKLQSLTFQKIQHSVNTLDSQPTFDGGVVVTVSGHLKTDDDPPHGFYQTFVLKPANGSFFIEHDIFRLNYMG